MILVVGATGMLGMEVCRQLRDKGLAVRGLVRPGSAKEQTLLALGVSVVSGDLSSRAALANACADVSAIISTATAMGSTAKGNTLRAVDRAGQLLLVDVARESGVGHFIYVSVSPNLTDATPLVRYKREVAEAVRSSGMQWTILQPSVFMEVWLSSLLGWDFANARAMIFGSGIPAISWISVHDVARYCVLAVQDSRLANRDVPLGGPEALSPNAVVKVFEAVSGRQYKTKRAPAVLLAMLAPVVSLLDDRKGSGMSLGAQCARGDYLGSELQNQVGLDLTSVRQYAERTIAALP